jgi:hypothetical protein
MFRRQNLPIPQVLTYLTDPLGKNSLSHSIHQTSWHLRTEAEPTPGTWCFNYVTGGGPSQDKGECF